jgi:signal transduction histidine kinase/ActR/RegA family two-component response regulator
MLSVLALGFAVLMGVSTVMERQVTRDLALIQERFIPLIALGPKLEQSFERLRRGLQDAVAALDADALNGTKALKAELLRTLREGQHALRPQDARALTREVEAYYQAAFDVSHRLLAGESGHDLTLAMRAMQAKHAEVTARLRSATALDSDAMAMAFAEASSAQRTATRVRLVVSFGSLGVVLILSILISRELLRSLSELGAGLARFGRGEFGVLIREQGDQELLQLARQANQMAQSLERIGHERDRQQEKLQQMNTELSTRSAELASVSNYKSQFLANMSHELRTPLNSMLVLSGLLADNDAGNLSDKQVEFCKTIHGAGTDLLALINQVLDLAKIEAGKQDVEVAPIPLKDLADYARRIFEPLARDKKLEFSVSIDARLPAQIESDRRRVEQILNNLLGNAIKFTERGKVTLRLASPPEDPSLLALEIADTGMGIPLEHQGRIFAAFEQLDASADRRHGGSGLGLSIARELSVLLGGEIRLRSAPGRGSTFACYLPLVFKRNGQSVQPAKRVADPAAPGIEGVERRGSAREQNVEPKVEAARENADAMLSTRPANLFDGAIILVADDDMRTLYALSALLHAKGAEVLTADSSESALSELERHPETRAVLMDARMPELDGYAVLRSIRESPRFRHLPVVTLGDCTDLADRDACMRAGAAAHLAKPVDPERLCALLHKLLHEPAPSGAPTAV